MAPLVTKDDREVQAEVDNIGILSPRHSDCSTTSVSQSQYAHGGSEYAMADPSTQPSPTWVYER